MLLLLPQVTTDVREVFRSAADSVRRPLIKLPRELICQVLEEKHPAQLLQGEFLCLS